MSGGLVTKAQTTDRRARHGREGRTGRPVRLRGDMMNYTGMKQMMANGQMLIEVREIGDYEGVIGWAAGLGQAGCANAAASDNILTLTFIQSGL